MRLLERLWPGKRAQPVVPELVPLEGSGSDGTDLRYEVNPQLAVIESYALDVIGELSPEEVTEADDAVTGLFGDSPDWRQQVRQHLGWNPLMDAVIADNWCRFRKKVKQAGGDPEPAEFARRFADEVVRLSKT
jgi:hypothetical protein